MPGANEILGCPRKYFAFLSQNFRRPFFVVHLNFSLFSQQLSNSREFAPVLHHAPVTTFLNFFFGHLPTFFKKTGPLDAPQGGCPRPSHRPHPPLHATAYSFFSLIQ